MPSFSLTLEDTSPLISYSPEWTAGSSSDAAAFRYSASTFQLTQTAGATASLSFNGTGIQIFGAKRGNHGQYQVRVDNAVSSAQNGQDTNEQFQAILYEVHGLTQGKHDVSIMNLGSQQFLDVDFITIEGNIGQANQKLYVNTFEDTDPSFSYAPTEAQWTTNPSNLGTYSGSSGHATSNPGTQMAFNFNGDGVSLYGPLSTNGSPYTVELDGVATSNLTTIRDRYIPQSMLYHASGLGEGPHRLVVKYQPTSSGQIFAVDYAQVYTTRNSAASNSSSPSGLSGGTIVGIILAVAIIIGAIIAIVWLLLVRKVKLRPGARNQDPEKPSNGVGSVYPFFSQNEVQATRVRPTTHSSFGPGPATAAPMMYPASLPARSATIRSYGASTTVGGLSVYTNLGHGSFNYGDQPRYNNNQLGLIPGPEDTSPSDTSPSDTVTGTQLFRGGTLNNPGRIDLGPNGYPLEKVPRPEPEDNVSPGTGAGPSSVYPFSTNTAVGGSHLGQGSGNEERDCLGDGLNPPDYAHATGGPRVR